MKQLFVIMTMLLSASVLYAQDIITLRTGETINGKVYEVGITEVKYYKSSNLQAAGLCSGENGGQPDCLPERQYRCICHNTAANHGGNAATSSANRHC